MSSSMYKSQIDQINNNIERYRREIEQNLRQYES